MKQFKKITWWQKITGLFLIWRTGLFIVAIIAPTFIPKFGNQFPYANSDLIPSHLPQWVWSFANFDGVHYVRAAQTGYESQYSQAFFPLYFLLIKDLAVLMSPVLAGLILSNLFFLGGLLIFYKLLSNNFDQVLAFKVIILLMAFPTAFYFGSLYTESLFFFLVVTALWYLRYNNFFFAGLFALLASATRVIGVLLTPIIFWIVYQHYHPKKIMIRTWEGTKAFLGVFLAPMGIFFYMLYLWTNFQDPLLFLNAQPEFGAQRSAIPIILFPQVLYRYFKIISSVSFYSQAFFNAGLELGFFLIMLLILILTFKKTPKDYWFFSLAVLIIPTLTGTLSSIPRYSLMCFLIFPALVSVLGRFYWPLIAFFAAVEIILTTTFLRGYWVA